jgi:hypothetical protein
MVQIVRTARTAASRELLISGTGPLLCFEYSLLSVLAK